MTPEDQTIRSGFPQLLRKVHGKPLIYFDNAASTLKHTSVIESLNHYYTHDVSNIHRGIHYLSEYGTQAFEETRKSIQQFIGAAHPHEIIFTKGTTESINLVASSFGRPFLKKGDEILLSTMEHHSNIVPWQLIAGERGAVIKEIPITDSGGN